MALQREHWITLAVTVLLLAGWELSSRGDAGPSLFFPPPSVIGTALARGLAGGELLDHLMITLRRVTMGVFLGSLPAAALGLAMGWWPRFGAAVDPVVAALHPLPKIALLPLLMIVLGIGEAPKVAVVAIGAFFPMLLSALAGVRQIEPRLFEVVRSYGAGSRATFSRVVLPGSLPLLVTGLRLAFNVGLLVAIASELVAARTGLGVVLWNAWETLRTERLYAALVLIALVGICANALLGALGRRLVPWRA